MFVGWILKGGAEKGTYVEHSLQDNNLQKFFLSVFICHLNRYIYMHMYIYIYYIYIYIYTHI